MTKYDYTGLIIDVGANIGDFSVEIAERNKNLLVLSVEPNEKIFSVLQQRIEKEKIKNIVPIKIALGNINENRTFNICSSGDCGVSSLLDFNNNNLEKNDYWKTRTDLSFTEKVNVKVDRLDNILKDFPLEIPIKFIKIDTQGYDLQVLEGLGNLISRVEMGCIEVFTTKNNALYENSNCDILSALKYLEGKRLVVQKIKPNDPANNESNIFFSKESLDLHNHEEEINIKNMLGYDDKDYWHNFSQRLHPELVTTAEITLNEIEKLKIQVAKLEEQKSYLEAKLKIRP